MHEGPGISMQKVMTRFKAKSSGGKLEARPAQLALQKVKGKDKLK